jgi:hypothetical protein
MKMNARQIKAGIAQKPLVFRQLVTPAIADNPKNITNAKISEKVRSRQKNSGIRYMSNLKKRKPLPAATIIMSILFIVRALPSYVGHSSHIRKRAPVG